MKALRILLAACVLLAGAAAQAQVADAPGRLVKMADGRLLAPDIARIVNRGEVVVAMLDKDNPPFFSVQGGKLVGTDVEMAKRVARDLGVNVRFDRSPTTYDGVAEAVAAGRADLGISRLARTLKRGQYVHFSNTYMRLRHALLINRVRFAALSGNKQPDEVIRNFRGKLGVLGKSSWVEFSARNFPHAQVTVFDSWEQAVAAAKRGDVDAAYRDELEVQQIVRKEPGLALSLRTVTFEDLESPLAMMVGIGDPTLLSFVNEVIAQWGDKPTVDSVLKAMR